MMKATKCDRVATFQRYDWFFGALAWDVLAKMAPIITLEFSSIKNKLILFNFIEKNSNVMIGVVFVRKSQARAPKSQS